MSEVATQILDQMQEVPAPTVSPIAEVKPKPEERASSKMEMLIRREQQALARERQAKEQMAQAQTVLQKIKEFEDAKTNPKKAMELLGLNYDELTKSVLSDGQIPPEVEIKRLREELSGFKQSQEEKERRQAEDLKRQAESQESEATQNFKSEIKSYIANDVSRYELINFDERFDEVYELIDKHYQRSGTIMKIAEAADKIEEFYEKREMDKKNLTKLQSIWGNVPKTTLAQAVSQEASRQKPKTLTNQMSQTTKLPEPVNEQQRIKEILAQFIAQKRV